MDVIDFNELLAYVKVHTSTYDESHDFKHALSVYENCKQIIKLEDLSEKVDWNVIAYAALLHDVCDHKYTSSISKEEMKDFVGSKLGEEKASNVMRIINNISYSLEAKGKLEILDEPYQTYRNIISDADKLEALGEVGLRRCQQFSAVHNGDVIEHCHEKLLRLLPAGFIRTTAGKKLALPGHNYILDYCSRNNSI